MRFSPINYCIEASFKCSVQCIPSAMVSTLPAHHSFWPVRSNGAMLYAFLLGPALQMGPTCCPSFKETQHQILHFITLEFQHAWAARPTSHTPDYKSPTMGLAAYQTRSIRWIIPLMGIATCALTWLRFHDPRLQGDDASWNGQRVSDEQRIQEQEALKEHQFQESIQDIMNATLGVHDPRHFHRCFFVANKFVVQ